MCDSKTATSCPSRGALRTQIEQSAKENICILNAVLCSAKRQRTKRFNGSWRCEGQYIIGAQQEELTGGR